VAGAGGAGGATLTALAADAASAYGLRPHFSVVDELGVWASTTNPRGVWEAVVSAVPKVRGGRLVVLTSAGSPAHWSFRVLGQARRSRAWRVNEMPGPCPWVDPGALEEQRALLAPSAYARLHLNRWTQPEGMLTSADDLRACVTLDGAQPPVPGERYLLTLDVGLVKDRTAVAVTHLDRRAEGWPRVVLDRLETWQGSRSKPVQLRTIGEWIGEASRVYNRAPLRYDPFQAIGLAQDLTRAGVSAEPFTFSSASVGQVATALHNAIRDRALALPDDPGLLDELGNVRLRETTPRVYRLDHDPDKHDDRAVVLGWRASTGGVRRAARRLCSWSSSPRRGMVLARRGCRRVLGVGGAWAGPGGAAWDGDAGPGERGDRV
jgi:hypothetical protein